MVFVSALSEIGIDSALDNDVYAESKNATEVSLSNVMMYLLSCKDDICDFGRKYGNLKKYFLILQH